MCMEVAMATPQDVQQPLTPTSPVSVMVSYSRTDSAFVDPLQRDLEKRGFPAWVDRRDIDGGAKWDREIRNAIDVAQVVLVVLSPAAVDSKWVRKEYTYALQHGKVVIPLSYYPCDIPAALAPLQLIDFRPNFFNAQAYYAQQRARLTDTIAGYESLDVGAVTPIRVSGRRGPSVALVVIAFFAAMLSLASGYNRGVLMPDAARANARTVF